MYGGEEKELKQWPWPPADIYIETAGKQALGTGFRCTATHTEAFLLREE